MASLDVGQVLRSLIRWARPSTDRSMVLSPTWQTSSPAAARDAHELNVTGRLAVLLNARASGVTKRAYAEVLRTFSSAHVFWSEDLVQARSHIATIVRRGYRGVLVGGGDGTFAYAANLFFELYDEGHADFVPVLGVLKLGTGNALGYLTGAGDLRLDLALHAAKEPRSEGRLGLVRDESDGFLFPFASMGYDAQVLNDYADASKRWHNPISRRLGRSLAGYAWSIATRTLPKELMHRAPELRLEAIGHVSAIDPTTGEEVPLEPGALLFEGKARTVAVGTSPFYGFGIKALPYAQRRADRMHVRISTASATYLLTHLGDLWRGTLDTPDIKDFLVEGVRVEASAEVPVQVAGEAYGRKTRVEWRLSDRSIGLLSGSRSLSAP